LRASRRASRQPYAERERRGRAHDAKYAPQIEASLLLQPVPSRDAILDTLDELEFVIFNPPIFLIGIDLCELDSLLDATRLFLPLPSLNQADDSLARMVMLDEQRGPGAAVWA
jgi:hypothetical protein